MKKGFYAKDTNMYYEHTLKGADHHIEIEKRPDRRYVLNTDDYTWSLPIETVQSEKHNLITAERDKRILEGFSFNGFQIQADSGSQAIAHQYLTKQIAGMVVFPITWRTMDNQYMQIIDSVEFTAFTDAMTAHINGHFAESWTAKDQIDSAVSVEEVETIFNTYMEA